MSSASETKIDEGVVDQAIHHIDHHGGGYENWYVGIEEKGSDRDTSQNRHPMRYELDSEDEAKLTMSWFLGMGLMADDEYGAEPTILFIYTE